MRNILVLLLLIILSASILTIIFDAYLYRMNKQLLKEVIYLKRIRQIEMVLLKKLSKK